MPFKIDGPEVYYIIKDAECCRTWPLVTETFTHGSKGVKRHSWHWRKCGLCGQVPILMEGRFDE